MSESPGHHVSVQFQVGLLKGQIAVEKSEMSLQFLKTIATTFISEKFSEQNPGKITEKILLFKHDYSSPNILQVKLAKSLHKYQIVCQAQASITFSWTDISLISI